MWDMNSVGLVGLLSLATLLPFLIAGGTCFIKFSIVFSLIRNAIGLQQAPSNMTLNSIALLLAAFIMSPVAMQGYDYYQQEGVDFRNTESVQNFIDNGLSGYKNYLYRFSDKELLTFFNNIYQQQYPITEDHKPKGENPNAKNSSLFTLLASYSLSEIKSAFILGFYIYLPFIVVDLLVSNILLALGMMMMSPVTISLPIKLVLFVAIDGWSKVATGIVMQYAELWKSAG
ncbi:EscR/YscR/HrcR family type III secretion system export apparatus protein [Escherichia albertii]|uniref:EscR/YscR/HrcR family type III secretion system export apparatus protein n=1 Tax=Escherichia albertii TaxID=208962 RepID=UPI0010F523CE|nr:EscR/YscR/HrcR family type III secretion system export apparatus protein [Escherichia albertii]MCZ8687422.1 EscR/YscR/HrcR family type III secretion system export apparatus protein [Escherichia albertii]MCZ8730145.1 EscR/YscR/HrcR family type III secretion system export apparatus protein [Escherichia albertii]MCZ8882243.1 EscR/YscR/HrcR family type III secretion system export apparatus protein [Escherichia albertii]MCZ8894757.1 EscR/YscR/HrcR family type III secretion system export apparatus